MFSFLGLNRQPQIDLNDALTLYVRHAPDLSTSRRRSYELAVRRWRTLGGENDVRQIATESFVAVRKAGLEHGLRPATIEYYISAISALLRHCGPPSERCPHGLGLLRKNPYTGRRLSQRTEIRSAVPLDALSEMYESADLFQFAPQGVQRAVWWRCFFVLAYNTGLRISDLLTLPWSAVIESERKIVCRAKKTGRIHEIPMNDVTAKHVSMLRKGHDTLLGSSTRQIDYVRALLRRTCDAVGVGAFSPQAIRRRTAWEFERAHPGAGPLILGHTLPRGLSTSFVSYINALEVILRPAADQILQPKAFVRG